MTHDSRGHDALAECDSYGRSIRVVRLDEDQLKEILGAFDRGPGRLSWKDQESLDALLRRARSIVRKLEQLDARQ